METTKTDWSTGSPSINPIVASGTATFEWHGPKPPGLIGDFNRWDSGNQIQLAAAGKELWRHTVRLPDTAYIEYAYILDGKRVDDPNNPRHVYNGLNAHNHYFYMPNGSATPYAGKVRGVARGTIKRYSVDGKFFLGKAGKSASLFRREVRLYRPPVNDAVPLLVVFDGQDYLNRAQLPLIVDNLIHQKQIQPIALAFVANGRENRFVEYACSDATLGFIEYNVLPLAKKELNLVDRSDHPGAYGVLGASMGGLIALYAGLRSPELFGRVISQSGAFYPRFVASDLVKARFGQSLKIWMDVGTMEYLNAYNHEMHALLLENGYDVRFHEYAGGHNFTSWRDDLTAGLVSLFGR